MCLMLSKRAIFDTSNGSILSHLDSNSEGCVKLFMDLWGVPRLTLVVMGYGLP